jgi:hypothetical protein
MPDEEGASMADDDSQNERRRHRGRRYSHVIEAKAVDVTPPAPDAAPAPSAPEAAPADTPPAVEQASVVVQSTVVEQAPAVEPAPAAEAAAQPEPAPQNLVAAANPEPAPAPVVEARREPEPPPAPRPEIIPPPAAPPPPAKPRYALPIAAAGLIGALFGAAGGALAPGLIGSPPPAPAQQAVDPARVQRLEQGLAALQAQPAPASAPAAAPPAAAPGLSAEEGARLAGRIAELEAELARRGARQEQQVDERIDRRLAALPAPAMAAPPPVVDLAPLAGRIDGLDKALAAIGQRAEAAQAAADQGVKAVAEADRRIAEARSAAEAGVKAVEPKLEELAAGLSRTAQRVEIVAAAPLFGAAQALGQAFERGAPVGLELAAIEALGAKPEQLQALRAFAEKGAPTPQRIAEAFRPLAMAAAKAGQPPAAGVQAVFESFVRTRATGPGAADSPDGLVSAIENALRAGDIGAALAAWEKLPEASRKATEAWASAARGREAARQAIRAVEEQALAALRKSAS